MSISPKNRVRDAMRTMKGSIIATFVIVVSLLAAGIAFFWAPSRLSPLADLFYVTYGMMNHTLIGITLLGVAIGGGAVFMQCFALAMDSKRLEASLNEIPTKSTQEGMEKVNPRKRVKQAYRTMRWSIVLTAAYILMLAVGAVSAFWAPTRLSLLSELLGVDEFTVTGYCVVTAMFGFFFAGVFVLFQILSLWRDSEQLDEILDDVPQETSPEAPTAGKETPKVIPSVSE